MSARVAARLAWGLAALAPVLLTTGFGFTLAAGDATKLGADALLSALAIVFSVVGALIASRRPGNAIGWIFLAAAVATGLGTLAGEYADYVFDRDAGPEWLRDVAASYATVSWVPFILIPSTFLLLLFPDGHLLSRRWRAIAWCAGVGIAGTFVTQVLHPGPLEDFPDFPNPYGVDSPWLQALEGLAALVLVVGLVGSALSLVLRFRRAAGQQRQQIKWLALAGATAAATVPVAVIGYDFWGEDASNAAIMISVLALPVAAGIAILRHRLYDIDVVINRTLVYGALTATLLGAYLGLVLLFQLVLSPLTEQSDLAIAGSTLAVAALFRPLRGRIQGLVDRRFYRRKYDAALTLEGFGSRLRDQVDLDALASDLRGVVGETMQPAHVSLWVRADR